MKKSVRRVLTGVVVVAVGFLGVTSLTGGSSEPLGPIKTVVAERTELRSLTRATGTVQPTRQIALSFPSVGRVAVVNVEPGQRVTQGQVIAETDSSVARIEVTSREAALAEALARVDGFKGQVTAADRAVFVATVEAAKSTSTQAERSASQQSEVNDASAAQLDATVEIASSQQARDISVLATEEVRLVEAQSKVDRETASRSEQMTYLDVAKANVQVAQKRRNEVRDQLATVRVDSARLNIQSAEAQRELDRVTADYERLRAANAGAVDGNGNAVVLLVPDTQVVAARGALSAVSARISAAEAEVVRVQTVLDVAVDALAAADRELATIQAKFDGIDGKVVSAQAALEGTRQRVESQRETTARSSDAMVNAETAMSAGKTRDRQTMVAAKNQRLAAEAALRTAQREQRQRQQGAKPSEIRGALALVDVAAASLELAEDALAKSQLIAPFDGVIASVGVKVGEQIGTSAAALGGAGGAGGGAGSSTAGTIVLVDASSVLIRLPLPEVDAARVKDSAAAVVTFESLPDAKPLTAKVDSVEPTPTIVNGVSTYTARVLIVGAPSNVRLGMTASVEILLGTRTNVLTVPAETLSEKDGTTSVSVVEIVDKKEVISVRPVSVGDRAEGRVEIVDGLKAGEKVEVPQAEKGAK